MKLGDYIVTNSGQRVSLSEGCPTIEDIATSLSRQPRFAGHTRERWSVAQHSLFVACMAHEFGASPFVQLLALLHDAHEALTGDIPTPFKTAMLKAFQHRLDERIFTKFVPGYPDVYVLDALDRISGYDKRALLVEALWVGPEAIETTRDCLRHFGGIPRLVDEQVFQYNDLRHHAPETIARKFLQEFGRLSDEMDVGTVQ